ncbi:helix-turn-helix domain-containing protein [Actinomadura geliboluensis]|uniref:helix-turn-helix domain-containing protein n=1 Tax=Actinomadura geliboluensis TaxID=882440 RepID=UPI0026331C1A|nr:helix-turn-helix transcriptional regulator [Actinomadura geliboluensis]
MSATADRRSPTIARRRLSRELRRLRHDAGLTADKVRGDIDLSQGKMNRLETGIGPQPNISDIRVLLDYYKVADDEREALLNLARLSRERGWWERDFGDVLGSAYAGFEAEAARIYTYQPLVIPGLLQTVPYARAAIRGGLIRDPDEIQRRIDYRLTRQRILQHADPPELWAVIDEAAVSRPFGTKDDREEQLRRLIDTGESEHITVQVIPFSAGMHAGLASSFTLLEYARDPTIVHIEMGPNALYLEKADEIESHRLKFQHLQATALDKDTSVRFLTRLLGKVRDET